MIDLVFPLVSPEKITSRVKILARMPIEIALPIGTRVGLCVLRKGQKERLAEAIIISSSQRPAWEMTKSHLEKLGYDDWLIEHAISASKLLLGPKEQSFIDVEIAYAYEAGLTALSSIECF